jgi:Tfp pilus assembly protein PilX
MKTLLRSLPARQQGAATLVAVMALFLVMALLAAYANRSLLFEQRIASSYFRASLAQEVAEAGAEWTLAQLNGTAADATCKPVATGGQRFADRYLTINAADRTISRAASDTRWIADCARDMTNDGWACRCPAADAAHTSQTASAGAELTPSFDVRFVATDRGGTVMLKVQGCTDSVADNCGAKMDVISKNQLAKTNLSVHLGLVSAVRNPPASALVVKGDLHSTGAGLGLHNSDARSGGLLATIGGTWAGMVDSRLESVPGTANSQVVVQSDAVLAAPGTTAADVFRMFMGTSVTRYPQHPALRKVTCAGDCTNALETAYNAGQRMLWVEGDLAISSNKVLGSLSDPVLIIANGDVALTGPFQLNGMLVAKGALNWTNTSAMPSLVNGIVLVGAGMDTAGRMDIVYQQTVADQVRNRMGSYVRISGGWIDRDM